MNRLSRGACSLAIGGLLGVCAPPPSVVPEPPAVATAAPTPTPEPTPELAPTPRPSKERPLAPDQPADVAPPACRDAACWRGLAEAATRRGALDVAAAHLGRAFDATPDSETLNAWIDALLAYGDVERARQALTRARRRGLAGAAQRLTARLTAAPASAPPSSDALQSAYRAEAAGELDAAIAAYERALGPDSDPADLARAATLLEQRGDVAAAGRLWTAARQRLRGRLHLQTATSWIPQVIAWRGNDLAIASWLRSSFRDNEAGGLSLHGPATHERRLYFTRSPRSFAFSDDGQTLVRDEDGDIVLQDMVSGAVSRRIASGDPKVNQLAATGSAGELLVLGASGSTVRLWNARGELLAAYVLQGTTLTVARVYNGRGTEHDTVYRGVPSWVVSLALTPELVAIGGSDGEIRLIDRTGGGERRLATTWPELSWGAEQRYEINIPLALRLVDRKLVSVHARGDILTWNTADGALRRRVDGACSAAELAAVGDTTASDHYRRVCGWATEAAIDPDGVFVATGGTTANARVREVATGTTRAVSTWRSVGSNHLAFARGGELALVGLHGDIARWRPGLRAFEPDPPRRRWNDFATQLSRDGRWLWLDRSEPDVWDLVERRRIDPRRSPGEKVVEMSPSGGLVAIRTDDALEIRELATRATRVSVPLPAGRWFDVQFTDGGARALIALREGKSRRSALADVGAGTHTWLALPADERAQLVSDDGRWIVTAKLTDSDTDRVQLRGIATGELVHELGTRVGPFAFSRDGAWLVWLARLDDGSEPHVEARALKIGERRPRRLAVGRGWPKYATFGPGDEAALLLDSGRLIRWRPATGGRRIVDEDELIAVKRVDIPAPGTLLVETFLGLEIRANDRRTRRLARLAMFESGGWMAISDAGAIDGSADAVEHLVTHASGPHGDAVYDGRLAWDAVHVDGVLVRALAGEDVAPPLPLDASP